MRVPSINRLRVNNIMVSRQTVISSVATVEKTSPSFEIQNTTSNFSDNFWLSKDMFYDYLEKMNKETEIFSDYELAPQEFQSSENYSDSPKDEILDFIKTVIEKYNQVIDHIVKIDNLKGLNNINKITKVISSYNRPLSNLGISSSRNHHLLIDEVKFIKTALKSPHHLKLLLDPEKGILRKIHESFKDVM